jgi:hypothetical protein
MYGFLKIFLEQLPADLLPYDIILGTVNRQPGVGAIWRNMGSTFTKGPWGLPILAPQASDELNNIRNIPNIFL